MIVGLHHMNMYAFHFKYWLWFERGWWRHGRDRLASLGFTNHARCLLNITPHGRSLSLSLKEEGSIWCRVIIRKSLRLWFVRLPLFWHYCCHLIVYLPKLLGWDPLAWIDNPYVTPWLLTTPWPQDIRVPSSFKSSIHPYVNVYPIINPASSIRG